MNNPKFIIHAFTHYLVELTKGEWALIDAEDVDKVGQHSWYFSPSDGRCSPKARTRIGGKVISLHIFLTGMKNVDHINGNSLDNRRKNLRPSSTMQNNRNVTARKNNTSGYKGVVKVKSGWAAQIGYRGKNIKLGTFPDKTMAAIMYNEAAKIYHGEFARLNEIEEAA